MHASEYYTSKIQQDWERQYFKDKRVVEEREERERERKREIERKRKEREREREERNQQNTQARYQNNNNQARQGGPIKMTKAEEEYVKKQERQNQRYNN